MIRTGVHATEDEHKAIMDAVNRARLTPAISFNPLKSDMASTAWDDAMKKIHKIAMGHGLREIPGYYGYDSKNKEFLSQFPSTDPEDTP